MDLQSIKFKVYGKFRPNEDFSYIEQEGYLYKGLGINGLEWHNDVTHIPSGQCIYSAKASVPAAMAFIDEFTKFFNPALDIEVLKDLVRINKAVYKLCEANADKIWSEGGDVHEQSQFSGETD